MVSQIDPPTVHYCPSCEAPVYSNPVPAARVAVVDGGSVLLVKVESGDRPLWGTPGGIVEAGENPDQTGIRELEEVTGLRGAVSDFVLFDARTFVKFEATHQTSLCYAVDQRDLTGDHSPGTEVLETRFWAVDDFLEATDRLLTNWPSAHQSLSWWQTHAQEALQASTP